MEWCAGPSAEPRPAHAVPPMATCVQDEIADALERIIAGPEKKGAVSWA